MMKPLTGTVDTSLVRQHTLKFSGKTASELYSRIFAVSESTVPQEFACQCERQYSSNPDLISYIENIVMQSMR